MFVTFYLEKTKQMLRTDVYFDSTPHMFDLKEIKISESNDKLYMTNPFEQFKTFEQLVEQCNKIHALLD